MDAEVQASLLLCVRLPTCYPLSQVSPIAPISVIPRRSVGCVPRVNRALMHNEIVPLAQRSVPLITLPLNTSEDRVAGSFDLATALEHGQSYFAPGLLALANRGFLYVDEINLLNDSTVDLLLDAAALGVNRVERDTISTIHPARFVLIGTMNPEEGGLRPQLLDRIGLYADAEDMRESCHTCNRCRATPCLRC